MILLGPRRQDRFMYATRPGHGGLGRKCKFIVGPVLLTLPWNRLIRSSNTSSTHFRVSNQTILSTQWPLIILRPSEKVKCWHTDIHYMMGQWRIRELLAVNPKHPNDHLFHSESQHSRVKVWCDAIQQWERGDPERQTQRFYQGSRGFKVSCRTSGCSAQMGLPKYL